MVHVVLHSVHQTANVIVHQLALWTCPYSPEQRYTEYIKSPFSLKEMHVALCLPSWFFRWILKAFNKWTPFSNTGLTIIPLLCCIDSEQCKYGKNRVEADAKRLQAKEEELMKKKQDIRNHLTQLKKERRDLRTAVEAAAGTAPDFSCSLSQSWGSSP